MRWSPRGRSADLEDRRGQQVSRGGGLRMGSAGPLGIGGLLIVAVLSLVTGTDFLSLLDPGAGGATTQPGSEAPPAPITASPAEERLVEFVSFVFDDAQETWTKLLGNRYQKATIVLFRDAVESACGMAQSASGPFYCPGDHKVYIDLGFYQELRDRFGAPGEFAQAYVLAHEVGHHVQTLLGTEQQVRQLQGRNPGAANDLSVRMELQADCYAGVWGNSTAQRDILERGDVEQGLNAAASIGDDRIQRMGGGRVSRENFTHGSSAQRVEWFKRGLETGNPRNCDTFAR
jgi:predicted metalloprotease